ncbi:hypothetical protein [Mesorhizobium sp. M1322]|uniref:hypothetical protein n=1 Tax=Mesorhizobium sp. M1322 TaxID=2957081 RepID=UPI00333CE3DE
MGKASNNWHLYWVTSDGYEDCFVAAKNSRSARCVECRENDFELGEVIAERIVSIPENVVRNYKRQDRYKKNPWPWYVYGRKIFKDLGAEFRNIENTEEMLLCDIVFSVEDYRTCGIEKERSIGYRAVDELRKDPGLSDLVNNYDEEDVWNGPVIHIITMLGMCLIRCHPNRESHRKLFFTWSFKEAKT